MPVRNVKELVAFARAKPGALNAGAGNFGSGTHLVTMYFLHALGIKDQATFVPYKSMGGAFVDAMAGRLHLAVSSIVSAAPHFSAGRLRALAVTGAERAESLPDTPTVAEQGMPGFEASAWNGLVAPAATPAKIVARLSEESARAARSPEIRDKLKSLGSKAIGSTPAEFRQLVATEVPRWGQLVKTLGIKQN
jgi:tripartite-type tricarboxylate transporter receptor subunit TctC